MPTTRPSGIVVPEGTDPPDFDGAIFPDLAESIEDNFATEADVTAHTGDNTGVHGIANTADLYRAGGVDVPVVDGGTGASNAVNARTNLGLVIGTDVSAPHAHPYEASGAVATHAATPHAGDHPDTDHATLATSASLTAHTGDSGIHGGGVHPDLTVHDALGLATDAQLTAHAGTPHGGTHPDASTHQAMGLASQLELTDHTDTTSDVHGISDVADLATTSEVNSAVASGVGTHEAASNPHAGYATDADLAAHTENSSIHGGEGGGEHPDLAFHDTMGLATDAELDSVVSAFAGHSHDTSHSHTDAEIPGTIARDAEVTAEVSAAVAAHAGTPHGGTHPDLATHDALGLVPDTLLVASGMGVMTTNGARPTNYAAIHWILNVEPTNAISSDIWTNPALGAGSIDGGTA